MSAYAARTPPADNTDGVRNRAQVNAEIRSIARIAGLGQEFVDGLIDRGATADDARLRQAGPVGGGTFEIF